MDGEQARISSGTLQGVQTAAEVFRLVSVSLDLNQTLNSVLDGLKSLIDYDAAGIYLVESDSSRLRAQVVRGHAKDGWSIGLGEGAVGRVLGSGAPVRESSPEGMFATLFYVELDVKARRLIYINAGHLPALVVRADGGREALVSGGPPLGIIERPHYLEEFAALAQGDVLAIYTDGVTEAMNSAGEEYGPARLADAISRARAGSAGEIRRAVTRIW
jgi:Stage II sporulation protein E (SpoIIE)